MQRPAGQHVFNIISEHHRRDGGEYAPVQATSPQQEAATSAMRSQSLPGGTGKIMTLQKGAAGLKVLPVMLVAGSMIVFVQLGRPCPLLTGGAGFVADAVAPPNLWRVRCGSGAGFSAAAGS